MLGHPTIGDSVNLIVFILGSDDRMGDLCSYCSNNKQNNENPFVLFVGKHIVKTISSLPPASDAAPTEDEITQMKIQCGFIDTLMVDYHMSLFSPWSLRWLSRRKKYRFFDEYFVKRKRCL